MKYEELPEKIQEKTLRFVKKNGETSQYVSLINKDETAFGWYNLEHEASIGFLTENFQKEHEPEEYEKMRQERRDKFAEERKANILATAQKIPESEYNGVVFEYDDDGYFHSIEDFKDQFIQRFIENYGGNETYLSEEEHAIMSNEDSTEEEMEKIALNHLPEFVYPAQAFGPNEVTTNDIFELMFNECESWEEFDYEPEGKAELKAALDKFYELNKNTGYFVPDESKIVILEKKL